MSAGLDESSDRATGLIGRETDIAKIRDLARPGGPALVTLSGQPGVGKTAVAVEMAALLGATEHRTVLVRLSAAASTAELLLVVAAHIDIPDGDGTLLDRLGDVRDVPDWLILDNCEHLAGSPHPIAVLQQAWPQVRILTTSARPLRLPGEHVVWVEPLALPPADPDSEEIRTSPAVRLYLRRAAESSPGFSAEQVPLREIAELCHRVAGLPLGIELIAARVATMPPGSAARLLWSQSLIGLEQPRVREPVAARHQSLRSALRWSYDLVTADAARLLRRMSLFTGPITVSRLLAWQTTGVQDPHDIGRQESELLDQLAELVDVRLVRTRPAGGHAVFELLPLVRAFALEQLELQGETASARAQRRTAILELVESQKDALLRAADPYPMEELGQCEPDLREVLEECVATGSVADGLRLATGLALMIFQRGYDGFVADTLERLLQQGSDDAPEALRIEAMLAHAQIRLLTERRAALARDQEHLVEATARAFAADDQRLHLLAHALVIRTLPATQDMAGAARSSVLGLTLAASLGDQMWLARFSGWATMAATMHDDTDRAVALAGRGVDAVAVCQDRVASGILWLALQSLPAAGARPLLARLPRLEDLIAAARAARDRRGESLLLRVAAGAACVRGDLAATARYAQGCLRVGRSALHADASITIAAALTAVAAGRGDAVSAARFLGMMDHGQVVFAAGTPPAWMASHQATTERVRAALGAGFDAAFQVGVEDPLAEQASILLAYADRVVAESVPDPDPDPIRIPAQRTPLTPRERDVLIAMATGATNKQISTELGVSPKTVMHHSVSIYRKLGVRSRAEATAWAYKSGLLS